MERGLTSTPLTSSAPSTSAPSSVGNVTLEVVMAQFQRIDARLNTLTTEMYQVSTYVGRIARWQAHLGGFVESPSPKASEDEDDDSDSGNDVDATANEDASSSGDNEMTTSQ